MNVSKEQIASSRKADLSAFVLAHHPDLFKKTSNNLYRKGNASLVIRIGSCGYKDYATSETGNSIDYLTMHLGYSFQEAVVALGRFAPSRQTAEPEADAANPNVSANTLILPKPAKMPHSRMYAFLSSRGIPKEMIDYLSSQKLIYQEAGMNNIVFVNRERDYCELRGTYTFAAKAFHGCRKTRSDRFWYFFGGNKKPEHVYVTEAAIDAISLFLIQKKNHIDTSRSVFASIGGVSNDATINRISRGIRTILAVDNDPAGDLCRSRHNNLETLIPTYKDWNEDLQRQ